MSCVACAVRTCSACVGAMATPSMRRRSWRQASSRPSTPCCRACSQPCKAVRQRLALQSSASADSASAGNSPVSTNCSGSSSQAWTSGASPRAWSSTRSTAAPKRRDTPARGSARSAPQVRQPMRSRLATCGRKAVSVCRGRLSGPCAGRACPANATRSRACATRAVGPLPQITGAPVGCAPAAVPSPAGPHSPATWGSGGPEPLADAPAQAQACSTWASSTSRPPHSRSVVDTSSSTASASTSATRGVKRRAHQPAAAVGTAPAGGADASSHQGNGSAIQCMRPPLWPRPQGHQRLQ
ncbi:hypothetical protein D3C71_1164370 [compost metagenome]